MSRNTKVEATIKHTAVLAAPTDNLFRTLSVAATYTRFECAPLDAEVVAARPRRHHVVLFDENMHTMHLHRAPAREEREQVA
jgi:hypothetical protein